MNHHLNVLTGKQAVKSPLNEKESNKNPPARHVINDMIINHISIDIPFLAENLKP